MKLLPEMSKVGQSKRVAIAIPLYMREHFTSAEEVSLRHLEHYLHGYDKYLVAAECLNIRRDGYEVLRFDDRYFGSVASNTKLMLSREFYQSFSSYEYVLIYQLDALVFSDDLIDWCDAGYDYIGAPWIPCDDTPKVQVPQVGNGGFSLRKVSSFMRVVNSNDYAMPPDQYWVENFASKPKHRQLMNLHRKYLKRLKMFNSVRRDISRYKRNEDRFWSEEAPKYNSNFRVAPVNAGLKFAFEAAPRLCYELNDHAMPFGCHAWARYDEDFWIPYLLK